MFMCDYKCFQVRLRVSVCLYLYLCVYVCVCLYLCLCMYVCVSVCLFKHANSCLHMNAQFFNNLYNDPTFGDNTFFLLAAVNSRFPICNLLPCQLLSETPYSFCLHFSRYLSLSSFISFLFSLFISLDNVFFYFLSSLFSCFLLHFCLHSISFFVLFSFPF